MNFNEMTSLNICVSLVEKEKMNIPGKLYDYSVSCRCDSARKSRRNHSRTIENFCCRSTMISSRTKRSMEDERLKSREML